ncbi:membrane bound O-acyl transferase family-domain-containing protein [Panaeolus papilionaceus]|nr:membrane bound O-acyl transferase family-domain-containing protein [Panaeolus papilionaceus]
MSTHRVVNLQPLALYPAVEVLYLASLSVKPSSIYRRLLFPPIALLSLYFLLYSGLSLSEYQQIYAAGCRFASLILFASTDVLLSNPQRDFRQIPTPKTPISDAPLGARVYWALKIFFNPRGINYAHEAVAHTPARPTETTKRAFVLRQLKRQLVWTAVWEFCILANLYNPYVRRLVDPKDIEGLQKLWRVGAVTYWLSIPYSMETSYRIMSIVAVVGGWSEPRNWPDLFGSFLEAYTVRRLWSNVWHQTFRRVLKAHAEFTASKLGLPRKGRASQIFKLFFVFALSGILHWSGDLMGTGVFYYTQTLVMFLLQPFAIMFEDLVISLFRKFGFKKTRWTKAIGLVWVFLWAVWSTKGSFDLHMREGYCNGYNPRIGVTSKLVTGSWFYTIPDK